MSSRFRTFLVTALVPLLVSTPALALDEDDYKALSHVLAVGLPAVAGGISLAKGGAAGLYQLVLQRDKSTPFETPLLKWLGPWQFITFMGQLESGRVVPDALLFGMRVNFKPAQGLEIGLSRTAQWCGEGRPCDLGTFGNLLIGNDNNDATLSAADEPGNQLGGIDIRWAGSVMNRPGAVYGQMIGEDEAGGLPSRRFGMAGIETWGGQHAGASWRAYLEIADTTGGLQRDQTFYNMAYNHHTYQSGFRCRDKSLGHGADNDSKIQTLGLLLSDRHERAWHLTAGPNSTGMTAASTPSPRAIGNTGHRSCATRGRSTAARSQWTSAFTTVDWWEKAAARPTPAWR